VADLQRDGKHCTVEHSTYSGRFRLPAAAGDTIPWDMEQTDTAEATLQMTSWDLKGWGFYRAWMSSVNGE
jgi:hypothetical protein